MAVALVFLALISWFVERVPALMRLCTLILVSFRLEGFLPSFRRKLRMSGECTINLVEWRPEPPTSKLKEVREGSQAPRRC
jgi:hypothetical protein